MTYIFLSKEDNILAFEMKLNNRGTMWNPKLANIMGYKERARDSTFFV